MPMAKIWNFDERFILVFPVQIMGRTINLDDYISLRDINVAGSMSARNFFNLNLLKTNFW